MIILKIAVFVFPFAVSLMLKYLSTWVVFAELGIPKDRKEVKELQNKGTRERLEKLLQEQATTN